MSRRPNEGPGPETFRISETAGTTRMGYRQKCCSKRIARSSRWISTANGGERFIQFMPEFQTARALLIRFSSSSNTGRGHTSHHAGLLVCSGRRRRGGSARVKRARWWWASFHLPASRCCVRSIELAKEIQSPSLLLEFPCESPRILGRQRWWLPPTCAGSPTSLDRWAKWACQRRPEKPRFWLVRKFLIRD